MDTVMEKKMKNKSRNASSDKDSENENGAEGFQAIYDELQRSKKEEEEKANRNLMNENFQEEKPLKKTDIDDTEVEVEISQKTDGSHRDGIAKNAIKYFNGETTLKYSGNEEVRAKEESAEKHKKKKKKKRSVEAEIEEKVEDGKEQEIKEETPKEIMRIRDPEIGEKAAKKKKKKKRAGGNGIEAVENTEEGFEDGTAKEEDNTEKSHKKKKKKKRAERDAIEPVENSKEEIEYRTAKEEENTKKSHKKKKKKKKRSEGNGIEPVEISEERIEDGSTQEEDNTERSPKKTKKSSKGEGYGNVEEKEKRKKKTKKSNEGDGYDNVDVQEKGMKNSEGEGYDNVEEKEKRKKKTKKNNEGGGYDNVDVQQKGKKSSEGEGYDNAEEKEKRTKKRKRGEFASGNANRGESLPIESSSSSKKQKKVTFSDRVEVFVTGDEKNGEKGMDGNSNAATSGEGSDSELVWGKRFSKAEDKAIINAISAYLEERGFEEEKGLHMILNCMKYSEVRNCWKEIAASLPQRSVMSVYLRAHVLYERAEEPGWTKDEIIALKSLQAKHGNNWKKISEFLRKNRYHVKDTWRRIKRGGTNSGSWSQDEYQKLFDLVNQNLQLKSLEKEEKRTRNVLRDNINWEAIADRMETRDHVYCCKKWYYSLASSMVQTGEWENADDNALLMSLLETNASDEEAVDWNTLVEGRSGETCLKRWRQMVKHLGECRSKPFLEKLEMLVKRYIPDLIK